MRCPRAASPPSRATSANDKGKAFLLDVIAECNFLPVPLGHLEHLEELLAYHSTRHPSWRKARCVRVPDLAPGARGRGHEAGREVVHAGGDVGARGVVRGVGARAPGAAPARGTEAGAAKGVETGAKAAKGARGRVGKEEKRAAKQGGPGIGRANSAAVTTLPFAESVSDARRHAKTALQVAVPLQGRTGHPLGGKAAKGRDHLRPGAGSKPQVHRAVGGVLHWMAVVGARTTLSLAPLQGSR